MCLISLIDDDLFGALHLEISEVGIPCYKWFGATHLEKQMRNACLPAGR